MTKTKHTHSPWSGKEYQNPPSVEELTEESAAVLRSHPTISKATQLSAMDEFIAAYKKQHGLAEAPER